LTRRIALHVKANPDDSDRNGNAGLVSPGFMMRVDYL